MKKTAIIVLALALAACATVVLGQVAAPGGQGGQFRGQGFGGGLTCPAMALAPPSAMLIDRLDTLGLSEETKGKLKASLTKSDGILQPRRQKATDSCRALREAMLAPSYDAEKVKQLLGDCQTAEAAIVTAELQAWAEIRTKLTADELSKLREAMGRRMGAGQGRRQRGPDAGTPPPPAPAPGQ